MAWYVSVVAHTTIRRLTAKPRAERRKTGTNPHERKVAMSGFGWALSSHSSIGLPGRPGCNGRCVRTFPGLAEAEKVPGLASFATDVLARS